MRQKAYKKKGISAIGKIVVLIIFLILIDQAATANQILLKFASYGGPCMYYKKEAEQRFLSEITRQTYNVIQIQSRYDSLLKSNEILDSVRSGNVDLGHVNIAFYPKRLILNSAIYLFQRGPVQYENIMWVFDRIYRDLPVLTKEIEGFNQKIIYTYANLPTAVFFNKPASRFSDFDGKRILCPSRWALEILKGLGAVPITTSIENLYEALKTNAIEGVFATYGVTRQRKFEQITKHIIIARELWTPLPFHITINLDTWNRLPEEIKKGIESAAVSARKKMVQDYLRWFEWAMAEHKKLGCTIGFASKDDINLWTDQPEATLILNQWKAEAESAGFKDTDILLKKIQQTIHDGIARDKM